MKLNHIYQGDSLEVLKTFPDECVDTIVTSPPYYNLRDYGVKGQIGLEQTLEEYLDKILKITFELKRVLKPSGVMFWDHGDCYNSTPKGNKRNYQHYEGSTFNDLLERYGDTKKTFLKTISAKCLILQNYRLIIRMIDEQNWILRNSIIWHKPNPMPSSVRDRFSNSYEPVYMLTKNKNYFFDLTAVKIPRKDNKAKSKNATRKHKGYGNPTYSGFEYDASKYIEGKNPGDVFTIDEENIDETILEKTIRFFIEQSPELLPKYLEYLNKILPNDVWNIATEPFSEAHFATFPVKLLEPIINSSCPKNVCKKCGKPRERIKETIGQEQVSWGVDRKARVIGKSGKPAMKNITRTVGWTDCGCGEGWTKGVVLDCFMGSGTTALVALIFKRNFVGIELNPKYIEMAKTRTKPRNVERERKKLFEKKTIEEKVTSWEEQTRLEDFQEGCS